MFYICTGKWKKSIDLINKLKRVKSVEFKGDEEEKCESRWYGYRGRDVIEDTELAL